MKTRLTIYGCAQSILYAVCIMGWNLYSKFLSQFFQFSSIYTDVLATDAIKDVEAAKAILTEAQRNAAAKAARIRLIESAQVSRSNWQTLKLYIMKSFDKSVVASMLESAGLRYYAKASADNFNALRNLLEASNSFIEQHADVLTTQGGMPKDFQDKFTHDSQSCYDFSAKFYDLELQKGKLAKQKLEANNAIYEALISMLKDGQRIFEKNAAIKKQFAFVQLLSIVRGHHTATMRGLIASEEGKALEGVRIYTAGNAFDVQTDKKGRYTITRIAAGNYTFIVERAGYQPLELNVTIRPGIANTINAVMEAAQGMLQAA